MPVIMLRNVRLSFPDLFIPKPGLDGGEPKYAAHFLFEKNSEPYMLTEKAIKEAAKEKFLEKAPQVLEALKNEPKKLCLRNGDIMLNQDSYAGLYFVSARSKNRPKVVDRSRRDVSAADGIVYAGCYVNAQIDIYAMKHEVGGHQVNASLLGVQFLRDGEAFAGGKTAKNEDFDPLETENDQI